MLFFYCKTMPFLAKDKLQTFYKSGLSMQDIAIDQDVSLHKVAYWFKKYEITPRSRSEASYLKKNPLGDPFRLANIDNNQKSELLALGVALYLGEGSKKQKYAVRLANSDPGIIKIFLKFLFTICGVKKEKIRAWINIFSDLKYKESL
jgi:hypothetical protein